MFTSSMPRSLSLVALAIALVVLISPAMADLNPSAIAYQLPNQLKWTSIENGGALRAILRGDPAKPGPYIILVRWTAHHMSRPHYHPQDRFVTVLSGTWWAGTGPKFDPDSTVPLPAGSFARHFANQIHYDGAKDADVVLEIVGDGPAPEIPAEQK